MRDAAGSAAGTEGAVPDVSFAPWDGDGEAKSSSALATEAFSVEIV